MNIEIIIFFIILSLNNIIIFYLFINKLKSLNKYYVFNDEKEDSVKVFHSEVIDDEREIEIERQRSNMEV